MKKVNSAAVSLLNRVLGFFDLQLRRRHSGIWDSDQEFLRLYERLRNRTLVRIDRCYALYQFAKSQALSPRGEVAQVGVYRGGTARMVAECFLSSRKRVYLFDTFEGLPQASKDDGANGAQNNEEKQFTDTDFSEVKEYFSDLPNVEFRKGFFPDTARGLENQEFCFVYLDADLYRSTKDGLDFFYPRMVPGGVIIMDDYGTKGWPGVEKAAREFCTENNVAPVKTVWWQGLIIKR